MSAQSLPADRLLAIDELDQAIVNLAARINAATYELLVMIREFDERAGWLKWGLESCSQWLHWRCDLSRCTAREKVRVAHALRELPQIARAFSEGKLSYSKVRALTRVTTPANEGELLTFALSTTAARVEERCRQLRNSRPDATEMANRAHARRSVHVWRDLERGVLTLDVELPLEAGELVCQALDRAIEAQGPPGPELEAESWGAQQADALVTVARRFLSGDSGEAGAADGYQVIVHVDGAALRGEEGRSDLPLESVKRLGCDSSVVAMVDGLDGEPLGVGRKQRTVPAALRRALWSRDRGCSFPGCPHRRHVAAHHIRHWADGGETSIENTMLLCSRHHRLVHEGGYSIRKDYQGRWYFCRPDGRAVPAHGYQPADMVDDLIDWVRDDELYGSADAAAAPRMAAGGASAEAPGVSTGQACGFTHPGEVRESPGAYLSVRSIPPGATARGSSSHGPSSAMRHAPRKMRFTSASLSRSPDSPASTRRPLSRI